MFQHAIYRVAEKMGYDAFGDLLNYRLKAEHNGFEITRIFGLPVMEAADSELKGLRDAELGILSRVRRKVFGRHRCHFVENEKGFSYAQIPWGNAEDIYLDGYWQSADYFDKCVNDIHELFSFPCLGKRNQELIGLIENSNSIFMHVRLGDYLNSKVHTNLVTTDYYSNAIRWIKQNIEKPVLYVFSNQPSWVIDQDFGLPTHVVDWNTGSDSWQDMCIMSRCKCGIIANSSFSWWGAYLNKNADAILTPNSWFSAKGFDSSHIAPKSWIRI